MSAAFPWRKLGRVFEPQSVPGRSWLREFAQGPATLLLDDCVRVYFSCRPLPDASGRYVSYSAFLELERADLFRIRRVSDHPILGLGGLGEFDEFGTYPVSIARDGARVLAYYGGWTRCESVPFNVAIGLAVSRDGGNTFDKFGCGPVLSYTPDEPFVLSGPKIRRYHDRWHLFYIAGRKWKLVNGKPEPVYKIRMATSGDGVNWIRMNRDLIESRVEEDEAQASPDVFYSHGKYHMFFSYRYSSDYRNKQNGYRIGYACSTDLVHWARNDSKAGLDVSDSGWDSEMVSYPHVFEVDGRIYLAYLGNQVGRNGFGLARLEGALDSTQNVAFMKWRKLGRIFDPSDHPLPAGCKAFAQSPQTLVFDDFVRIYFSTRSVDESGKYVSHVAFVEMDKHLRTVLRVSESPVIGRGGLGCFDEHGIFPINVLRHNGEVLAYTCGWSRRVSVSVETAIGLAVSRDEGRTFQRVGDGPVLAASPGEPFLVGDGFVRICRGRFHMWYIFGTSWKRYDEAAPPDRTYKIGHAVSDDGVNWQKEDGRRIVEDRLGPDESQALPTMIEIDGVYHLFFCYRQSSDFRINPNRGYRIGHASSVDLKNWTRDDDHPALAGTAGSWDSDMQCYPHAASWDDGTYLLYNGNEFGKSGFGAAVLE